MRKLILVLSGLISCGVSLGQTSFLVSYGNSGYDFSRDVKQDMDTGYVITGSSSSFAPDNGDAFILKVDPDGNFVWSWNYGGPGADWGEEIIITYDSTYAIAGYTNSFGAGGFDFFLVRADIDGTPLWQKYYGGSDWDKAYCVAELADSGFVLVGESYSFSGGNMNGYIVRTNKNGDTLWTYVDTSSTGSFFRSVAVDGDSLIICGGIGDGGNNSFDGYIIKMHDSGNIGWNQQIGQGNNDYFNSVYAVNGVYSFGGVRSFDFANDKEDMWMYRINDDGTLVTNVTYVNPTPENDGIQDVIARDFDQDYYFVGYTSSYGYLLDGLPDVFMAKMTLTEIQFQEVNFGEAGNDIAFGIDRTFDGGVVVTGDTRWWATGGTNAFIMKIGPSWTYPDWFTDMAFDDMTNGIEDFVQIQNLSAYPNPVAEILHLPSFDSGALFIYDLSGKQVMSKDNIPSEVDLSKLNPGTYIVVVESESGIYQQRIIKL